MGKRKKTKTAAACHRGDDHCLLLLPEEVLIQILVRLPIQSLLLFKSVCKSWRDLIQTSYFIHLHTAATTSSSSSNFGTFILRTENFVSDNVILMLSSEEKDGSGSEYDDWYRYTDYANWLDRSGSEYGDWYRNTDYGNWRKNNQDVFKVDDQPLLKLTNLELPSCYKLTYSKLIVGSCNGLICLYDQELEDVSLWNPATRQFRILPKSITIAIHDDDDFVQHGIDFVAFGFDVKTKDYKVLLITRCCGAQVYSLSTDSWRLLEGINSTTSLAPAKNYYGLYLNGSCFFIASVYHRETNTYTKFINSFDFTKEIFTTMQIPDHDLLDLFLHCLGGEKIALFTTLRLTSSGEYEYHNDDHDSYEVCDMWVLNEHCGGSCGSSCGGVNKESWTKLHSFQIKNSRKGLPIGISNNGKFVFLETTEESYERRIQLYNLVTKEVKLDIPFCVCMSKVYVYKPSLVSILS